MSAVSEGNCSKCGLFSSLAPSNISRKTGKRLYRSWCISCEKDRKALWVQNNIEYVLKRTREYQANHPDQVKATKKRWNINNPEKVREIHKRLRQENPQHYRAQVSARRRKVRQNTPPWSKRKDLVSFYEQCPEGYHVDHMIPLRGKLVSGLHVINNLQYLPARENLRKFNHYEIDGGSI